MNFFDTRPDGIEVLEGDGFGPFSIKRIQSLSARQLRRLMECNGRLNATPIFQQPDAAVWLFTGFTGMPHGHDQYLVEYRFMFQAEGFVGVLIDRVVHVYDRFEFRGLGLRHEGE